METKKSFIDLIEPADRFHALSEATLLAEQGAAANP